MGPMNTVTNTLWTVLLFHGAISVAAIVIGLLIFFKGRAYVRRKYGMK